MITKRQCIKVHQLRQIGYQSLQQWLDSNSRHIYVGRSNGWVIGANKSIWHNPYTVKKYGLEKCLFLYKAYIINNKTLYDNLYTLKGYTLGCWCLPYQSCHCDVLINIINSL